MQAKIPNPPTPWYAWIPSYITAFQSSPVRIWNTNQVIYTYAHFHLDLATDTYVKNLFPYSSYCWNNFVLVLLFLSSESNWSMNFSMLYETNESRQGVYVLGIFYDAYYQLVLCFCYWTRELGQLNIMLILQLNGSSIKSLETRQ